MIRLDNLAGLLTAPGPYATAYLDATLAKELGPREVAQRWQALRGTLAEQGADAATLDAMEAVAGSHTEIPGPHGQVLVAAGGRLRMDTVLPAPPRRQIARWAPLPHLMPMIAQLRPLVPYVLALVDRTGGDVVVRGPHGEGEQTVQGDEYDVHKARVGGWSELRYQHRVENTWEANARLVAGSVESGVRQVGAQLVVLAGDVRARTALADALGERARGLVLQLEHGSRADGVDDERLVAGVGEAVARVAAEQDADAVERFTEARGRAGAGVGHGFAAAGLADTVATLRQAEVETLLVVDDPSSDAQCWIGPDPVHLALTEPELVGLGVREPVRDRLDAALVRAAAGTDATVVTLAEGQLDLPGGLGATLRYPMVK
jgi:Bacterial archaeo-eukaryotic release factor family 2